MGKDTFKKLELMSKETLPLCPLCGSELELWEENKCGNYVKAVCCSNTYGDDTDGDECPFFMPARCLEQPTRREAIAAFMDKAMPDKRYWAAR